MTPVPSSARLSSQQRDESPLFGRLVGRFHRYLAVRKTRRMLLDMDDHMLRDVGLSRGDLTFAGSDTWLQRTRRWP